MGADTGAGGGLRREIRWGAVAGFLARRRTGLLIGVGAALRVAQYLAGRPLWMDEGSLAGNIVGRPFVGLFGPLSNMQLAPPGFLVIEWIAARGLGHHDWALRLWPLAAGVAALFLFERFSRPFLGATAAWVALGMFALSDDLIYYASELKQYSSDVAVAIACGMMGVAMARGSATMTAGRLAGFAAGGAAAVWFSHPAVFVLAGAGVVAMAGAVGRRDWRSAAGLAVVGAAWVASFAGVYAVSGRQLGEGGGMWRFWAGAFPPRPASVAGGLGWAGRKVLYLFVNPLDFATPLGPRLSLLLVVPLFAVGCVALGRRDPEGLAILILPAGFALGASALRLYPAHGRLALFLVPSLVVPIAEGAGWLRARGLRGAAWAALLAVLLGFPALTDAYRLAVPRSRAELNPYGDRRPTSLDPMRFPF